VDLREFGSGTRPGSKKSCLTSVAVPNSGSDAFLTP
jgi:hypothetical protein